MNFKEMSHDQLEEKAKELTQKLKASMKKEDSHTSNIISTKLSKLAKELNRPQPDHQAKYKMGDIIVFDTSSGRNPHCLILLIEDICYNKGENTEYVTKILARFEDNKYQEPRGNLNYRPFAHVVDREKYSKHFNLLD